MLSKRPSCLWFLALFICEVLVTMFRRFPRVQGITVRKSYYLDSIWGEREVGPGDLGNPIQPRSQAGKSLARYFCQFKP